MADKSTKQGHSLPTPKAFVGLCESENSALADREVSGDHTPPKIVAPADHDNDDDESEERAKRSQKHSTPTLQQVKQVTDSIEPGSLTSALSTSLERITFPIHAPPFSERRQRSHTLPELSTDTAASRLLRTATEQAVAKMEEQELLGIGGLEGMHADSEVDGKNTATTLDDAVANAGLSSPTPYTGGQWGPAQIGGRQYSRDVAHRPILVREEKRKQNAFRTPEQDFMRPNMEIFGPELDGIAEILKGESNLYDTAQIVKDIVDDNEDFYSRAPTPENNGGNVHGRRVGPRESETEIVSGVGMWGPAIDSGEAKAVAILTSGGDAPGMNAAVRSCVGVCLSRNARIFAVRNGYKGLVTGGDNILELSWRDISDIMQKGGTVIGSARCPEMRTWKGRLHAACNLARLGINRLVVIGGDGSLTGAEKFKEEWPELLKEAVEKNMLDQEAADKVQFLCIVGMVGSIDNDMCGFSSTIGFDTALHRIVTACDALITTAKSHQRTFIVEVMGRNCGWLALMASIAVGADWVFLPESPPDVEDWETSLCEALESRRKQTNYSLVIVAEGATDRVRRPIESQYLRTILSDRLGHDTRVTCLGHVQRGGEASADDRVQGTLLGSEAALAILDATDSTPSRIVGIRYSHVVQLSLTGAVNKTKAVAEALKNRKYAEALRMRGPDFVDLFAKFKFIRHKRVPPIPEQAYRICLIHSGSPAAGMNAVTKAVVRTLVNKGHKVFGALDGYLGLSLGHVYELHWESVAQWNSMGGCKLGTNRVLPDRINGTEGVQRIAKTLEFYGIHGLVVVGGFEAYTGLATLLKHRANFPSLQIPMCCVPVTISNNVPGSEYSVGSDTAVNAIVDSIDRLKLSAASSRARVFLVEVMGGKCGYLAVMGALAGGADGSYIHEDVVSIEEMQHDVKYFRQKFGINFKKAVLVRNENCSRLYKMPFMQALFEQEGHRTAETNFTCRNIVLGHLQQGNRPSPLDRVRAIRIGSQAVDFLLGVLEDNRLHGTEFDNKSVVVVGLQGKDVATTPVDDLVDETDFTMRRPKHQWFLKLQPLIRLLELNNEGTWGDDIKYKLQSVLVPDEDI